jgi:uncharacterized peroxidase-related enzyme
MSFIETTDPHAADGEVADLYRRLQGKLDYVPNYAKVYCHRPDVMAPLAALQDTLKQHLAPRLWALISLAVAREIKSSYCSLAFARRLLRSHFTPHELLAIVSGSPDAPLLESERIAMDVATKLARDATAVNQQDINRLRRAGFTDAGIFDLVAAAAWRCFFARVPDALGVRPDAALAQLEPPLLQHLVVGRAIETDSSKTNHPRGSGPSQPHRRKRKTG